MHSLEILDHRHDREVPAMKPGATPRPEAHRENTGGYPHQAYQRNHGGPHHEGVQLPAIHQTGSFGS